MLFCSFQVVKFVDETLDGLRIVNGVVIPRTTPANIDEPELIQWDGKVYSYNRKTKSIVPAANSQPENSTAESGQQYSQLERSRAGEQTEAKPVDSKSRDADSEQQEVSDTISCPSTGMRVSLPHFQYVGISKICHCFERSCFV